MSTPQDSVSPVVRTGTSPLLASGKTSSVQLSEEVSGWIEGMSPSGATEYDTGWVALTTASGDSFNLAVRRTGSTVALRGEVFNVTAGTTMFTLAAEFRPTNRMAYDIVRTGGGAGATTGNARLFIQASGVVTLHNVTSMPAASPGLDVTATWLTA